MHHGISCQHPAKKICKEQCYLVLRRLGSSFSLVSLIQFFLSQLYKSFSGPRSHTVGFVNGCLGDKLFLFVSNGYAKVRRHSHFGVFRWSCHDRYCSNSILLKQSSKFWFLRGCLPCYCSHTLTTNKLKERQSWKIQSIFVNKRAFASLQCVICTRKAVSGLYHHRQEKAATRFVLIHSSLTAIVLTMRPVALSASIYSLWSLFSSVSNMQMGAKQW